MDDRLSALLEDLHRRGVEHDKGEIDRLERLRNLEPDTGRLLALLVRATAPRRVLELGTSNGYSTIWLADALRSVGGRLVSVDADPKRSALAAGNLERAGLADLVELRVEDAAGTLRSSATATWEMIFLDAGRPAYADYWPDLVRTLAPGGLLAVDNVVSHAQELREFRALVASAPGVSEAEVSTGAGLLLVVREPSLR